MYVMVTETDMFEVLLACASRRIQCIMLPYRKSLSPDLWTPFQGAQTYDRDQSRKILDLLVDKGLVQKESIQGAVPRNEYRLSTPYEIVQHKMNHDRTK